ncbi:MAG: universal stress protein [Rudaea sp.]
MYPFWATSRSGKLSGWRKKGCDLILLAAHGRRGVEGLLLGNEIRKVLAHSQIPVLVLRQVVAIPIQGAANTMRTTRHLQEYPKATK